MQLEIDSATNIITIEGVQFSVTALLMLAHPDPKALYKIERWGNTVHVRDVAKTARPTYPEGMIVH